MRVLDLGLLWTVSWATSVSSLLISRPSHVGRIRRAGMHRTIPLHKLQPSSALAAVHSPSLAALVSHPNSLAGLGLLVSTWIGRKADTRVPGTGILATLVVAAMLSNGGWVPSVHPLYDLSWSLFLPASLVLLLVGQRTDTKANDMLPTKRLAAPFVWATLGSILGCLLAFGQHTRLGMGMEDARIAASCLAASYIGGSVNFFATARLIGGASSSVVTSMAAADLLVMAVYFSCLGIMIRSNLLQQLFQQSNNLQNTSKSLQPCHTSTASASSRLGRLRGSILGGLFTYTIVQGARYLEVLVSGVVPGTACAWIAGLVPMLSTRLAKHYWWQDVQSVAANLSDRCFLLLFASIGMSADLISALRNGPSCLLFSLFALLIHIVVTLVGSCWMKRAFGQHSMALDVTLEEALVASNAAIGGPATAAAFCGQLPGPPRPGLALAATIWGVVGYAVGTTIGVTVYHRLSS